MSAVESSPLLQLLGDSDLRRSFAAARSPQFRQRAADVLPHAPSASVIADDGQVPQPQAAAPAPNLSRKFWDMIQHEVLGIAQHEIMRLSQPIASLFGLPAPVVWDMMSQIFSTYDAFFDALAITLRYHERSLRQAPYLFAEEVIQTVLRHAGVSPMLYAYLTSSSSASYGTSEESGMYDSTYYPYGSSPDYAQPYQRSFYLSSIVQRMEDGVRSIVQRFLNVVQGSLEDLKRRGYHVFPDIRFSDDPAVIEHQPQIHQLEFDSLDTSGQLPLYLSSIHRIHGTQAVENLKFPTNSSDDPNRILNSLPPLVAGPFEARFVASVTTSSLGVILQLLFARDPQKALERRYDEEESLAKRWYFVKRAERLLHETVSLGDVQFLRRLGVIAELMHNEAAAREHKKKMQALLSMYKDQALSRKAGGMTRNRSVPAKTPFMRWLFSPAFARRLAAHTALTLPSKTVARFKELYLDHPFIVEVLAAGKPLPQNVSEIPPLPPPGPEDEVPEIQLYNWQDDYYAFRELFSGCTKPGFLRLWDASSTVASTPNDEERMQIVYSWVTGKSPNLYRAQMKTDPFSQIPKSWIPMLRDMVLTKSNDDLRSLVQLCDSRLESSGGREALDKSVKNRYVFLSRFCSALIDCREAEREAPSAPYEYFPSARDQAKHQKRMSALQLLRSRALELYQIDEDFVNLEIQCAAEKLEADSSLTLASCLSEIVIKQAKFIAALDNLLKTEGLEKWYADRQDQYASMLDELWELVDDAEKVSRLRLYSIFGVRNVDRSEKSSSSKRRHHRHSADDDDSGSESEDEDSDDSESESDSDSENETLELQNAVRYSRIWTPTWYSLLVEREIQSLEMARKSSSSKSKAGDKKTHSKAAVKPWERARTRQGQSKASALYKIYGTSQGTQAWRTGGHGSVDEGVRQSNRRFSELDPSRDVVDKVRAYEKLRRQQAREVIREGDVPFDDLRQMLRDERMFEMRERENVDVEDDIDRWDALQIAARRRSLFQ